MSISWYIAAMAAGRLPEEGQARTEVLKVRLTPDAQEALDAARGEQGRSAFVRDAIRDKIRAAGGKK